MPGESELGDYRALGSNPDFVTNSLATLWLEEYNSLFMHLDKCVLSTSEKNVKMNKA